MHLKARSADIVLVAKYPPLQGGTSISALTAVRALVDHLGLRVTVVTSACDEPAWTRWSSASAVENRWLPEAEIIDVSSAERLVHLPEDRPLLSQLVGATQMAIEERNPALVVGWYLEPFGMAAATAASSLERPYALLHAGSDVARLPRDPWLKRAYQSALANSSSTFVTSPAEPVVEALAPNARLQRLEAQAAPEWHRSARVDDLQPRQGAIDAARTTLHAAPGAEALTELVADVPSCSGCDLRVLIIGKASSTKAIGPAVEATSNLTKRGVRVHLSLVTGGPRSYLERLARLVGTATALPEHLDIVPFVAPWDVPHLLQRYQAVLCLEHSHDVSFHASRVPMEVLLANAPALVVSTSLQRNLSWGDSLIDDRNCYLVDDPSQPSQIEHALGRAMGDEGTRAEVVARGRLLGESLQRLLPSEDAAASAIGDLMERL